MVCTCSTSLKLAATSTQQTDLAYLLSTLCCHNSRSLSQYISKSCTNHRSLQRLAHNSSSPPSKNAAQVTAPRRRSIPHKKAHNPSAISKTTTSATLSSIATKTARVQGCTMLRTTYGRGRTGHQQKWRAKNNSRPSTEKSERKD